MFESLDKIVILEQGKTTTVASHWNSLSHLKSITSKTQN